MNDLSRVEILLSILAVLGIGKMFELAAAKFLNRKVDTVATEKAQSEIHKNEVETVRQVLEEVKAHSATKDARIDKLENDLSRVEDRMEKMEERERHALTRAAVHEAWDQMAFQFILQHNPDWQPPPPLTSSPLSDPHSTATQTTTTTTTETSGTKELTS